MQTEIYADGIGEIVVTGSIVRLDLVSLSATEKDQNDKPKLVFCQRIILSTEGFANAAEVVLKALNGLVEAGAVRRVSEMPRPVATLPDSATPSSKAPNVSPNFN